MLTRAGFRPVRWWGIHSITNLIPSTVLHRYKLSSPIAALYACLRSIDRRLSTSLFARVANSLVVLAEKPRPTRRSHGLLQ